MLKLIALHKHWLAADAVKQFLFASIPVDDKNTLPEDLVEVAQAWSAMLRLEVFYALMYVVIEGYLGAWLSRSSRGRALSGNGILGRFSAVPQRHVPLSGRSHFSKAGGIPGGRGQRELVAEAIRCAKSILRAQPPDQRSAR